MSAISPRTLQEYWRSVKAQKDKDKKSSRRSSSPKKSSFKVIASTQSENLEVIPIAEPDSPEPIVDLSPEVIFSSSVPDGYWSQEEMNGYFNHY